MQSTENAVISGRYHNIHITSVLFHVAFLRLTDSEEEKIYPLAVRTESQSLITNYVIQVKANGHIKETMSSNLGGWIVENWACEQFEGVGFLFTEDDCEIYDSFAIVHNYLLFLCLRYDSQIIHL